MIWIWGIFTSGLEKFLPGGKKKKILVIVICRFILHLRDLKCRDCPCLGRSPAPSLWVLWCLSRTREGRISTWGNLRWWIATTSPRTHVKIAQGERKPGDIGSHCSGEELSKFLDCFPPQHRGCGLSLAWCFSHWNAQAACGKGKWPPARIWPSGSKETTLIPTPRGFGPPYPAQRVKPKHTSLGWLELKPPFACLELDNLSDTSCCTLCPLGHTCYCVTACLKNVGCCGKENDCNLACWNNLRAFFFPPCESLCHAWCVHQPALGREKGEGERKGEGEEGEEEGKARLAMLGKCFCDHTKRFKTGWKWSPPPLTRSLAASPLSLKELLRRISRVGF